ncbi:MAG TPA: hypothetical protein ENH02_08740 [Bacteroidetes bacterium]|nr:hypothetical protein [Bacteroidota bacterium]
MLHCPIKKYVLLLLSIFLLTNRSAAGGDIFPIGARQAGMGRTSVAITDFWNIQNNQAGIALIDKYSAGIYYESRFLINRLSTKDVAVVVPTGIGVLGATFNYFGYELYNEMKIGLVYARSFSPWFRMGLQLDYLITTLGDNYGSTGNVTFELGIQSDVAKNLTIGAWVYNPIQVKLADYNNEKIPAIFRLGLSWQILKGFIANVEAEKNTNIAPILVRAGLEYGFNGKFFIRGGFSTQQEIFSMGFGMKIKFLRFDISAVMHQTLGFSPQSSLIVQF